MVPAMNSRTSTRAASLQSRQPLHRGWKATRHAHAQHIVTEDGGAGVELLRVRAWANTEAQMEPAEVPGDHAGDDSCFADQVVNRAGGERARAPPPPKNESNCPAGHGSR